MSNVFIVFTKVFNDENDYYFEIEIVFDSERDAEQWVQAQRFPTLYVIKKYPICKITREEYQHNFSI